jgi:hypothetical protein
MTVSAAQDPAPDASTVKEMVGVLEERRAALGESGVFANGKEIELLLTHAKERMAKRPPGEAAVFGIEDVVGPMVFPISRAVHLPDKSTCLGISQTEVTPWLSRGQLSYAPAVPVADGGGDVVVLHEHEVESQSNCFFCLFGQNKQKPLEGSTA